MEICLYLENETPKSNMQEKIMYGHYQLFVSSKQIIISAMTRDKKGDRKVEQKKKCEY
jgi:hypothetical protein